jgi:hypothetical protein
MAPRRYSLEDWESDFVFLTNVCWCEYGYFPRDYTAEIQGHFREHYPSEAEFLFLRVSAMLTFLVKRVDAFIAAGLAMRTFEFVEMSPALRFALWMFFIAEDVKFDPDPDPQKVLELAEAVLDSGLFDRWED